ncbi:MAG TPA: hypothetical protein VMT87_15780, partial [Vicinamibacteria bacterium]|nr:hypothetical protein [Vicinamibacteria bacterium]
MIARPVPHRSGLVLALGLALAVLPSPPAQAAERGDWCRDEGSNDKPSHCEVREVTVSASPDTIAVDAAPNGGIDVTGWSRAEVRVLAKVTARGDSDEDARTLASQVRIETTGGTIRAEGPSTRSRRSWWVSYRLSVPEGVRLSLKTVNGGVSLRDV